LEAALESAASEEAGSVDIARRHDTVRRYFHFPEDTTCSAEVERWVWDVVGSGR
jgi:hypothetical protein